MLINNKWLFDPENTCDDIRCHDNDGHSDRLRAGRAV